METKLETIANDTVPRVVHESDMSRLERANKRLIAVIIFLIIVIGVMAYEWMQWDYEEITVDSRGYGNAAYMGDGASGVINNGQSQSAKEDTQEP